jgi:hypothetical protein
VAADLAPFGAPLAGRVDPFVSLGAGALRTSTRARALLPAPTARPEVPVAARASDAPRGPRTSTSVLLAPAVGARLWLRPDLAVQGDLRQLVTVGGGGRRFHPAFGTGVRLSF